MPGLLLMSVLLFLISLFLIGQSIMIINRVKITERDQNQEIIRRQLGEIEAIYQTAPIGLAILDCDLRFVRLNQRLAEINGISIKEHIGRTVREIVPDLADTTEPLFRQILETGKPLLDLEINGETPAQPGIQRTWIQSWFPLKDTSGKIIGINAVVQEITERKQAEITLRDKEQQLQELSDSMPQFVWTSNALGELEYINRQWCEFSGITLEQSRDANIMRECFHPDEAQLLFNQWAIAKETKQKYEFEGRLKRSIDGAYRWFLIRSIPVMDEFGQVQRWYGTSTDIHERKIAQLNEQFLTKLDSRLRKLSDADAMAWEVVSSVGEYLNVDRCVWNEIDAKANLAFVKQDWFVQNDIPSVIGTYKLSDFALPNLIKLYHAGQPVVVADVTTHPETAPFVDNYIPYGMSAYVAVPCVIQGNWLALLVVNAKTVRNWRQDEITLLKETVARLWTLIENTRVVQVLRAQTEELSHTNRLKDEFLAALSHELRTPLNPILGWTQLMKVQKLTPAKTAQALETIERNVKQQIKLVDDLLDVSSVIKGKLKLEFDKVDIASTIKCAIETLHFAAQAKDITIKFHGLPSLTTIADSSRLEQIFWNLLSNAIKFTPEGGRVDVDLSIVSNSNTTPIAQICVTDTGIGMAPEFLPHAFERFRQADGSTTRQYGGLGLGLAIVSHLVELHGGKVEVESPGVGQGSTFTVKLPLLENFEILGADASQFSLLSNNAATLIGLEYQNALSLSKEPLTACSNKGLMGIRIILVDDDPDNLDLLRFLLQEDGAIVTAVPLPLQALELLSANPPNLIISDIGMPQINGYELIRRVRALPQGQKIPALALTAFAQKEDQEEALKAGFWEYISKPVDPLQLLATVTQLIQTHLS
ncbi:MAG: PAS domain-containing protein [Calothrix sp. FI2-JRJ7]|jgi:PAS domain S-box-containing protein|nr:PAS domain-containing protein [Calothrix sp. FI2-JRJ7]